MGAASPKYKGSTRGRMESLNTGFTVDEWAAAIQTVQQGESVDGLSCRQLARGLGVSSTKMRRILRDLLEAEQIDVDYRMAPRIDGQMARVPVYRLREKGKGGEDDN